MSKALTLSRTVYSNWSDDVMSYLNSIRKFEVLTPEEETKIFDTIKNGTPEESTAAEIVGMQPAIHLRRGKTVRQGERHYGPHR